MGKRVGFRGRVQIGDSVVLGMGTWTLNGIQADQLDDTEFGDEWKKYKFGLKDGGDISFNGHYDPDDANGQEVLRLGNLEGRDFTNLRFYIDNTSYFEPCQTTGYFSPFNTSGMPTQLSYTNVVSWDVSKDKSDLMKTSLKCKMSGCLVLV